MSHSNRRRSRKKPSTRTTPLLGNEAVVVARRALEELGEGDVGEHVGVSGLTANVATHRFAAEVPGYPGWEWNAVLACASGSDYVTVNEVALVPAPTGEALRAPEWVPYDQRVLPGDLGPGDLMPPAPDDVRLTDDPEDPEAVEVGVDKRQSFLTRTGLNEALTRWRTGEYGPTSEFAEQAQLTCRTCAFFLPAGGVIGQNYGVCANEFSADGVLVHQTYGCGAHSETRLADDSEDPDYFDDEQPLFS